MRSRLLQYQLAEADAVKAARIAYQRRLRQPKIMVSLLALYGAIIALLAVLVGRGLLVPLLLAAIIAPPIALAIIGRVLVPRMARANYRQAAGLRGTARFEWSDGGFVIAHDRGSVMLAWADLAGIVVRDDLLLLFQSEMIYNLVPIGTLAPEQRADLYACSGIVP